MLQNPQADTVVWPNFCVVMCPIGMARQCSPNSVFLLLQDRMHLDCVFSVLGEKCCIMLETIIGEDSPSRRLVDEYVRDASGKYTLAR